MPIKDTAPNTRHAVPQNIMDVQFKLIGDLTMRQFFYLLIFFVIAYLAFISSIPALFRWPIIIISIGLGLGFAFVPLEDRGLDEWIVSFFKAVYGYNQMIWKKEPAPPSAFLYESLSFVKQEMITLAPTSSRRKLEKYLEYSPDTVEDPLDIPEQKYIQMVRAAFKPVVDVTATTNIPLPDISPVKVSKVKTPIISKTPPKDIRAASPRTDIAKKPFQRDDTFLKPITPDRHSGRKFTNLVSSSGSIVLPIKGEQIIMHPEETDGKEAMVKAEQLKVFMKRAKDSVPSVQVKQKAGLPTAPNAEIVTQTNAIDSATAEIAAPTVPNVLVGGIKNSRGTGIPEVMLIIKSPKEGPIRAIKTDALGNFSISTPLQNGKYQIETDINSVTGFTFDIISFEAKGGIISPIRIVGK